MNTIATEILTSKKAHIIAVWAMIGALGFFFISYAYLVNKTVLNVVAREKAQTTIAALSTTIGDLEFKEMNLKSSATISLAHTLGFIDVAAISFITQQPVTKGLSYNSHVE